MTVTSPSEIAKLDVAHSGPRGSLGTTGGASGCRSRCSTTTRPPGATWLFPSLSLRISTNHNHPGISPLTPETSALAFVANLPMTALRELLRRLVERDRDTAGKMFMRVIALLDKHRLGIYTPQSSEQILWASTIRQRLHSYSCSDRRRHGCR